MARPPTQGFRKPLIVVPRRAGKTAGLAMITEPEPGVLVCSCGNFTTLHPRRKVREDKAERHINKRHNGRGVWL